MKKHRKLGGIEVKTSLWSILKRNFIDLVELNQESVFHHISQYHRILRMSKVSHVEGLIPM